ncbi:MAG: tetratricopeptide repeat protein [Bacteroidota bacterium]
MIKKILNSFIPFIILLIGVFVLIIYLNSYAEQISGAPEVINIKAGNVVESENIVSFEIDESSTTLKRNLLKNDSTYIIARRHYKNENYDKALKIFKRLELRGNNSLVSNYLGLVSLKKHKYGDAYKYFKTATLLDSTFFAAYINLAVSSSKLRQYSNAEIAYRKAITINELNPKPHFNLALLLSNLERWDEAEAELKKSIELSSGEVKAKSYCYYGIAKLKLLDTISATKSFNKSIEYKPKYQLPRVYLAMISEDKQVRENELLKVYRLNTNSYYANFYLGKLYSEDNQIPKAEYHLRKALEINPNDEKIIEELSAFLVKQERYDEAELIIAGFSLYETLPQTYFHEAKLASKKGNIDEAIKLYGLAIKKSGFDYPEATLNQAVLYKNKKELKKAIESYLLAVKMKPNYSFAYYNLALLYTDMEDVKNAVSNYKLAIKYNFKSFKSWYGLASIYEKQQKYDKAVEAYKRAIWVKPDYLKALSSLGVLYSKLKQFNNAIGNYQSLVKKYPNYARAYYNMALAYTKSQQYPKAIEAYLKVIEIDPENIKAKINIGVLYARTGDINMAIKTFEDATDRDVENPGLRFNLALQYEKAGRFDDAIYQYIRAIQLKRNYTKAYNRLVGLYQNANDTPNALSTRLNWLKLNPDGKELYSVGKELYKLKEYEKAISAFELAEKNGAKKSWTAYWVGMIQFDLKEYDQSINYFKKSLKMDSKHKFALYRLGQVYELKSIKEKADIYYQRLLKIDPDFKIVHKKEINIVKKDGREIKTDEENSI